MNEYDETYGEFPPYSASIRPLQGQFQIFAQPKEILNRSALQQLENDIQWHKNEINRLELEHHEHDIKLEKLKQNLQLLLNGGKQLEIDL